MADRARNKNLHLRFTEEELFFFMKRFSDSGVCMPVKRRMILYEYDGKNRLTTIIQAIRRILMKLFECH